MTDIRDFVKSIHFLSMCKSTMSECISKVELEFDRQLQLFNYMALIEDNNVDLITKSADR